mgnify:CR=1 FL=1
MIVYNKNNYFLHYLGALSAQDHPDLVLKLCPQERALFEAIVLRWHQGSPMTVTQAVNLKELGSTVTLHKRLKSLFDQEVVVFKQKNDSMRRKYICPSPKSVLYLEWLSELIGKLPAQIDGNTQENRFKQAISDSVWSWEI